MAMRGLLYAAIQQQQPDTPVAEYARDSSQRDLVRKFLRLMKAHAASTPGEKRTFQQRDIQINSLVLSDRAVCIVACREGYNRGACFECLTEMGKAYDRLKSRPADLDTEVRKLADRYSDPSSDKISKIQSVIEQTKIQMVENIDRVIERGDKIDGLCERSELLVSEAAAFESGANKLKWTMYKKKIMMIIVVIVLIAIVIFLIALFACSQNGVNFNKCK
jgi:hypothetical protein